MNFHIKIVGLGAAGKCIVERIRLEMENMDCENVESFSFEGLNTFGSMSVERFSRKKILSTEGQDKYTRNLLLLVGGFGGRFASFEIPALVRFAKDRGFDVGVFASTPFRFEGQIRRELSNEAIESVKGVADFYTLFHNQDLMLDVLEKDDITLDQLFSKQNKIIADAVMTVVHSLTQRGLVVIDYLDVLGMWRSKPRFSFAKVDGLKGNFSVIKNAGRVLAQIYHGPKFALDEFSAIIEKMEDCIAADSFMLVSNMVNSNRSDKISIHILYEENCKL